MPGLDALLSETLRSHWGFRRVLLRPSLQGVNSITRVVETDGERFVVHARPLSPRISHEHGVLAYLAQRGLSFAVPAPVPSAAGATWVEAAGMAVTVTRWISGSAPEEGSLEQAQACGKALAELDRALASLPDASLPASANVRGSIEEWPDARYREVLLAMFEQTHAAEPGLSALPRQTIHRDFDQSNVLVDGDRVSGVLDFEFCGADIRVLDLTYALSQWPGRLRTSGKEGAVVESFARGYQSLLPLSEAEIEAVPDVLRRRWTTTLTFRQTRYEQRMVSEADLIAEGRELAEDFLWLERNEDKLRNQIRTGARQ